jgi:protein tyrosine phosphatase (PTP) superfamily phosphohydrolase (DUF442 family)
MNVLLGMILFFSLTSLSAAMEIPEPALDQITNFRQYTPLYASSGQPTPEQLQDLKDEGFERVAYIAFSNATGLPDEDVLVKGLGMQYLHIPVDWDKPLTSEFDHFADYMQRGKDSKTLLHCQINLRASAFSFLYRVIYQGVSVAEAKEDMNSVWQPTEVWRDFIFEVLAQHGKSAQCEGCDWTPSVF